MIRRVQYYVGQNVFHGAGPRLAFSVLIDNRVRKPGRRKLIEEIVPETGDLHDLRFTLIESEIGPHGQALWLFREALQPEPLGGENVRQELAGPQRRIPARLQA